MKLLSIILLCAASAASADDVKLGKAESPKQTIEGQVYITKQDAGTIKLGSVPIAIAETKRVAEVTKTLRRMWEAEDKNDEWKARSFTLANAAKKMSAAQTETANQTLALYRKLVLSNLTFVADCKIATGLASKGQLTRYNQIVNATYGTLVRTQTDPEGMFRVDLPPGDYTVRAYTTRALPRGKEDEYYWMVKVKPGERVLLNNSNLAGEELAAPR